MKGFVVRGVAELEWLAQPRELLPPAPLAPPGPGDGLRGDCQAPPTESLGTNCREAPELERNSCGGRGRVGARGGGGRWDGGGGA